MTGEDSVEEIGRWRWFGLMYWIAILLIAATALVWAGITLARAGDEIATRTGLGGLLVGMLLVAAVTSLPEIVTDVSAATAGAPDLAVGGSSGATWLTWRSWR